MEKKLNKTEKYQMGTEKGETPQQFFRVMAHNGRFHTRRWTNRLDGQIILDRQIVWCENGANKFPDDFVVWICPSVETIFWRRFVSPDE